MILLWVKGWGRGRKEGKRDFRLSGGETKKRWRRGSRREEREREREGEP